MWCSDDELDSWSTNRVLYSDFYDLCSFSHCLPLAIKQHLQTFKDDVSLHAKSSPLMKKKNGHRSSMVSGAFWQSKNAYMAARTDVWFIIQCYNTMLCVIFTDPTQLDEIVARWVADAHLRTCLYSSEHIADVLRKQALDISKVTYYKNMAHEELWFDCAQKLTLVIQQIIEFAKAVPGFRKFSQDDQIVLLKAGSFELAVLRMTRYYDVNQNCVVYGDALLPMEAFLTTETVEMKLVNNVFEFAKTIAELKLTDTELGLYSALVLLQADRPGLRGTEEIAKLNEAVGRSLCLELDKTHRYPVKGDVSVYAFLLAKMPALRELSMLHQEALSKFKRAAPHLQFSDLHKEIFNVDS
ncbi:probable nuclear hormone receptor HR3 [Panulirus ornatus]|uniref:probable nuclear hormone receptor HR3 n=1 Tax=Panulirus ornatus TaxID=150431 RepID=UPI003A8A0991